MALRSHAVQEDLVRMGLMKVEADAALAQKSAAQAARAARRRKEEVRQEFRMATTPNGLEVANSCICWKFTVLSWQTCPHIQHLLGEMH